MQYTTYYKCFDKIYYMNLGSSIYLHVQSFSSQHSITNLSGVMFWQSSQTMLFSPSHFLTKLTCRVDKINDTIKSNMWLCMFGEISSNALKVTTWAYEPIMQYCFPMYFHIISFSFFRNISNSQRYLWYRPYIIKMGHIRPKMYQKFRWESVVRFFATPVKCRCWPNIPSPTMQLSTKVISWKKLIFQILLTPIIYQMAIISTDLSTDISKIQVGIFWKCD